MQPCGDSSTSIEHSSQDCRSHGAEVLRVRPGRPTTMQVIYPCVPRQRKSPETHPVSRAWVDQANGARPCDLFQFHSRGPFAAECQGQPKPLLIRRCKRNQRRLEASFP